MRTASANGSHGMHWISDATRYRIYERDGNRCVYCGTAKGPRFTLDHLLPRCLGGTNAVTNLVSACASCNGSRQHKSLRQWFRELRRRGIDTSKIGRRIRRLVKKALPPKRKSL